MDKETAKVHNARKIIIINVWIPCPQRLHRNCILMACGPRLKIAHSEEKPSKDNEANVLRTPAGHTARSKGK